MRKPEIGDPVLYFPASSRGGRPATVPYAAFVAFVENDRQVNVAYFSHHGEHGFATAVRLHQEGDPMVPGARCEYRGTARPAANLAEVARRGEEPQAPPATRKRA